MRRRPRRGLRLRAFHEAFLLFQPGTAVARPSGMDGIVRDFRLAVRSLLRVPGFTIVAVLTLAVGLGTTTLMFTTAQ